MMLVMTQGIGNKYYLELTMFGSFAAASPPTPLIFRSDKVRALLVYLTLHPAQAVARAELVLLLYGDFPDQVGRKNLNLTLTRLRQSLAPVQAQMGDGVALLEVEREYVRLNWQPAWHWADALEFEALQAACQFHPHENLSYCTQCRQRLQRMVQLYKGDFVAGWQFADSPGFNEWRLWQQEIYLQQVMMALAALTEGALAAANHTQARLYARRQITLVPWQEGAYRHLMQSLAATGESAAALAQFTLLKQILADQLHVEPTPETLAQMRAIQREAKASPRSPSLPSAQTELPEAIRHVTALLIDPINRLVTLIGPTGDATELAQIVGEKLSGQFPHGVWFILLAELPTAHLDDLVSAIAAAFPSSPSTLSPQSSLLAYLRPRRLLLILDAFTPFIQPTAPEDGVTLVMNILQEAPQVVLLVVASRPLQLQQEIVYRL